MFALAANLDFLASCVLADFTAVFFRGIDLALARGMSAFVCIGHNKFLSG
jgi:hypothetical protein